jgi:hypothetical protein
VVAPLLLLVGLWVVPAALVIAVNMVVAFALMHTRQILMLNNTGGWALELGLLFRERPGRGQFQGQISQERLAPVISWFQCLLMLKP